MLFVFGLIFGSYVSHNLLFNQSLFLKPLEFDKSCQFISLDDLRKHLFLVLFFGLGLSELFLFCHFDRLEHNFSFSLLLLLSINPSKITLLYLLDKHFSSFEALYSFALLSLVLLFDVL